MAQADQRTIGLPLLGSKLYLPVGAALFAIILRLAAGPATIDDAYITFRYARNIAEGVGFVYNPGEHVLGTTTPLWTLLLAILYRIGFHDLPFTTLVIASLCDGITAGLLYSIACRLNFGKAMAALAAASFSLAPNSILYAISGMESSLFTLLVVVVMWASVRRSAGLAGWSTGLAILVRPEGLLLAALVFAGCLLRCGLSLRKFVPPCALAVAPWAVFALWWFGSPLPQSVAAKAIAYQAKPLDGAVDPLIGLIPPLVFASVCLLFLEPAYRAIRKRPELLPLLAFAPALLLAYLVAATRDIVIFDWYLVVLAPFATLGAAAALRCLTKNMRRAVRIAAVATLLGVFVTSLSRAYDGSLPLFSPNKADLVREQAYASAAELLASRVDGSTLVALPEIGIFGYQSSAKILDTVGLVSPAVLRFYPIQERLRRGKNAIPPDLILSEQPTYVVGVEEFFELLLNREWFSRDYRLIAFFEGRIFDLDQGVLVYERVWSPGSRS